MQARRKRSLPRREFLKVSGKAGLGALALTVGGHALRRGAHAMAQSGSAGTREFHLEARQVMWELAPGKRIKAMAYNGQIPGPALRLQEGERVRVVLTNALSEPTTLHWHGVDVPNGDWLETVPPGQLPSFALKKSQKVQEAYRYAVGHEDTLQYISCFCDCKNIGHQHNAACYITERLADGQVTFNSHAVG